MVEEMIGRMSSMRDRLKKEPRPLSSRTRRDLEKVIQDAEPIRRQLEEEEPSFKRNGQLLVLSNLALQLGDEYVKDTH